MVDAKGRCNLPSPKKYSRLFADIPTPTELQSHNLPRRKQHRFGPTDSLPPMGWEMEDGRRKGRSDGSEGRKERKTNEERRRPRRRRQAVLCHGCQMVIAGFLDRMCLALRTSGLWLRYATLQNLIPPFPWIAPPRPPPWRNPRKGRDQILPSGNSDPRGICSLSPSSTNGLLAFPAPDTGKVQGRNSIRRLKFGLSLPNPYTYRGERQVSDWVGLT